MKPSSAIAFFFLVFGLPVFAADLSDPSTSLLINPIDVNYRLQHSLVGDSPTRLGVELLGGQNYLTFLLNVGGYWPILPVFQSSESKTFLGVSGNFVSQYDFRTDLYSGPVVSTLMNPKVSLYLDDVESSYGGRTNREGDINWQLQIGWAHNSNGQIAQSESDFTKLSALSGDFNQQVFASMGWNYYFLSAATFLHFHFNDPDSQLLSAGLGAAGIELRAFFPQSGTWWKNFWPDWGGALEDQTTLKSPSENAPGIWHFDGVRIYETLDLSIIPIRATFIIPYPWNFSPGYFAMGLEETVFLDRLMNRVVDLVGLPRQIKLTFPLYFTMRMGTGWTPAQYFAMVNSAEIGVSFDSIQLLGSVSDRL